MSSTGIAEADVNAGAPAATCPRDGLGAHVASLERSFMVPRLTGTKSSSIKTAASVPGRATSTSPGWTPSTKPFGRRQPQRVARSRQLRSTEVSRFASSLRLSTPGDRKEVRMVLNGLRIY